MRDNRQRELRRRRVETKSTRYKSKTTTHNTTNKKDVPNVDFVCEPWSDTCWCKAEPMFKGLPNGSLSDTCYSPREIERFQRQTEILKAPNFEPK
jgi:hypothetical protein